MSAPLLHARGVTVTYGEHSVLESVDLAVEPGEAVALLGPNGSGKSTLLRVATGMQVPTAGEADLDGTALDERDPAVRRALAVVVDQMDFFPDLSAVEHLDLLARAHGVADPEPAVDEVLHEVGLTHVSGQLPATLSSGQRQRLLLASALVRPRRLLVLDEPEQRLDVDGVRWLGDRLLAEKAAGGAVLLASHDPALVDRVCDRTVSLGT